MSTEHDGHIEVAGIGGQTDWKGTEGVDLGSRKLFFDGVVKVFEKIGSAPLFLFVQLR